jgi:hypothetical protein
MFLEQLIIGYIQITLYSPMIRYISCVHNIEYIVAYIIYISIYTAEYLRVYIKASREAYNSVCTEDLTLAYDKIDTVASIT